MPSIIISGLAQSIYTSSFTFIPSGKIITLRCSVSSQFIETTIGRIVHPTELLTFSDRLITPTSYDKVSGKRTGVTTGSENYPDLYTKKQIAPAKGKATHLTGVSVYFSKKTKGKITPVKEDTITYQEQYTFIVAENYESIITEDGVYIITEYTPPSITIEKQEETINYSELLFRGRS